MDEFLLIIRIILFGVFSVAGIAKLFDPKGSRKALFDFGVPPVIVPPLVYFLPILEISTGVLLLFSETSWIGAVSAAGLLGIFSAGMAYQMAKGNAPDCHCFGQLHSEPVGPSGLVRNLGLLISAIFILAQGRASQGISLSGVNGNSMQVLFGTTVILFLIAILIFLKKVSAQQTQIMRRIELMELVGRDGGTVERDDVTHPHEGLPIGAVFPDHELPDVTGRIVTLADIKAKQLPTLYFFVSPTCSPCRALLPEFENWQAELAGQVEVVFVSSGSAEENLEKFGGKDGRMILLQKEREFAETLRAQWTPTAILMNANGRVASHVAAGDTAIRSLVEQIKSAELSIEPLHFENLNGHSHPNKIGFSVPSFSMTDINGNKVESQDLKGKQTVVAFWSLTCGYCDEMLADLRKWDNDRTAIDPKLLLFSDGDIEGNLKLDLSSPVVIDEGYKTSAEMGMYGTPSAVLVNEEGKIVSEIAIGAPNIWSLVGKQSKG